MIKVAVISTAGRIAELLNEFDTTGGELRYTSIKHGKSINNRILRRLVRALRFTLDIRHYDVLLIAYIGRPDYIYAWIAKKFGVPTIAQWVGTDVYKLLKSKKRYRGLDTYAVHLARSPILQEELATKGISAKVMWGAPRNISHSIAKMPEKHAVYIYMPQGREKFYGYDMVKKVIDRYPGLDFYISANTDKNLFPQTNAKLLGWISKEQIDELYDKISIVLRCPKHDGWSRVVMEGHFKGKEVIYNLFDAPYIRRASTVDEICSEIDDILSRPPTPRVDAHDYAMENFTPQFYSTRMAEEVKRVLISNS